VVTGLTGNATFPTPPVLATALATLRETFETALGAAIGGGVAQTAAKDNARAALVDALRQDALYVEQLAAGSETAILSTGYQVASRGHSPMAIMPKAEIKRIENAAGGSLLVRVNPIANAHSYEVQTQISGGAWQTVKTSSQARGILVSGLTPGTNYTIRVRAIGGGDSAGDWSDPLGHICT